MPHMPMNPLSAIHQPALNALTTPLGPHTDARAPGRLIPGADLQALGGTLSGSSDPSGARGANASFSTILEHMVQEVNAKQVAAAQTVQGLQSGQGVPLHEAMIAMEEASVSFQLMVEVRNRMLDSYQELMRMQV